MARSILHTGHDSGYQRKDILKTQHFLTSVGVPFLQYYAEEIFIFSGLKLLSLLKHTSYYCEESKCNKRFNNIMKYLNCTEVNCMIDLQLPHCLIW
ncbi:hypothetical protein T09_3523 [Trichinella sp. T9]|nr:hypothetical protein T09_3523 [Trichinella sp. T9]